MKNKIYIGNLSYDTTEDTLRTVFSKFGGIDDLIIIKDRETGRTKGFGFITFDSQQAAESALELNGTDLDGRTIKVNIAEEKKGGGGGGGRGGRW